MQMKVIPFNINEVNTSQLELEEKNGNRKSKMV